jgi:phenylalanine-4-hydroxylase
MGYSAYSPVTVSDDGSTHVELSEDHPGVSDPNYRRRRDELASLAASWHAGEPVPNPDYTDEEHEVWRIVSEALQDLHERFASESFQRAKADLKLTAEYIPGLGEVTAGLEPLVKFRFQPIAGLAPVRDFYGSFSDGVFWSTQYLRHPSVPLYTPEPDIIHEVIGHANQIADPAFAHIYRLVGAAVHRTKSEEALKFLSQVFWFTMEFGVVREKGELRAYGAGILSSVGETETFRQATVRPVDLVEMGTVDYDITHYQPLLYGFSSPTELEEVLTEFYTRFDDAYHEELLQQAS